MKSRTLVLTEPGHLEERTIELPDLGANDARIRTDHTGICGTDVHMYEGEMEVPYPVVPGHEFSGVVDALGSNVTTDAKGEQLEVGDSVAVVPGITCGECWYCENMPSRPLACSDRDVYGFRNVEEYPYAHGGMSEYVHLEEGTSFYRLPDDMDTSLGALAAPMSTGTHGLERAYQPGLPHLREGFGIGKSVAVQGAGPVGLMAMVAADTAGAGQIIALEAVPERLELSKEFGATDTVDITDYDSDAELVEAVHDLTVGGVGPDIVLGAAGTAPAVTSAFKLPHNGGTYVEIGHYHRASVEFDPGDLVQKELDVYGSLAYPPNQFETSIAILDRTREDVPYEKLFNFDAGFSEATSAYESMADGTAFCATIHP